MVNEESPMFLLYDTEGVLPSFGELAGSKMSIDEFSAAFHTFDKSAFRLETLPTYTVSHEDKRFGAYRAGEKQPPFKAEKWKATIKKATESGKSFEVIRLVPKPYTEYFCFEVDWAYCEYRKDGQATKLILPEAITPKIMDFIGADFWLFDDKWAIVIKYDKIGDLLGFFRVEEENLIQTLRNVRDESRRQCISLDEFLGNHYRSDRIVT